MKSTSLKRLSHTSRKGAEPVDQVPHPDGEHAQPADTSIPTNDSRPLEIVTAVVIAALTAAIYVLAHGIEVRSEVPGVGPRSWPQGLGIAGLGFSIILFLTSVFGHTADRSDLDRATRTGWRRLLLTVAVTVAFIVLWPLVGFIFVAPLLISAVTAIAGGRTIQALAVYPILTTAMIYVLFNVLLKVPL